MKNLIVILLVLFLTSFGVLGQSSVLTLNTNSMYKAGDFTLAVAPTISSGSLFSKGIKGSIYGYEGEISYFASQTIGTTLLLGNRDYSDRYPITYISTLADYRILPFADNKYLNKFAFTFETGAEQDFLYGSQGLDFGLGIDADIKIKNYHFRPNLSFLQSINTKSDINSTTIKFEVKLFSF